MLAMRVDGSAQDTEWAGGGVGGWSLHRIGPQGGRVARLVVLRFDDGVRPSHRRTATSRDGRSTMRERNHEPRRAVSAAMDAIRRPVRLAAALLTLAVVIAACAIGPASSTVPVAPSASAPPDTPVTAPPADPSSDPSVEPPVGEKPVVPKPGQAINVHPVAAESLSARVDGSTIVVKATWWSGVEPCTIFDSIVVDKGEGTYTVALREGSSPQEIACIAIAEQHVTEFEIPDVAAGTWKIVDSGGTAPPIEVTVG